MRVGRRSTVRVVLVAAAVALLAGTLAAPSSAETAPGPDRYDLVGGCHQLTVEGGPVAGPLRFQATDLGRYLLHQADGSVLRADPLGLDPAIQGGEPGPTADWHVTEAGAGFAFALDDGRALVAGPGGLRAGATPTAFGVAEADGCAELPDIDVGITGPVATGASAIDEVRGFLDDHLHITAFEFLGGRVHCGRPWHPYGVTYALQDCPDHAVADGAGAVVENLLSDGNPVGTHDPTGWPSFVDWPAPRSLTHEQTYHRWLERAWRGGVRLIVNLITDNRVLCEIYPLKQNSCDEMDSVRLQTQRLHQLERYIDAQAGGPGEGWFRIVDDPFTARAVINEGKVAVVNGIELSEPFGCRALLGMPQCTAAGVAQQLDELRDLGVNQAVVIHKFDNALGGVIGDSGTVGPITNVGNFLSTGGFLDMRSCDGLPDADHAQELPGLDPEGTGLFAAILQAFGPPQLAPVYGPGEQCNAAGLTALGHAAIDAMIDRQIIIDVDHMGVRSQLATLDRIEAAGYHGVLSSHSWTTEHAYPRVLAAGGHVSPYAGNSTAFVRAWEEHRARVDPRWYWGIGFGADANGLGHQGAPRGAGVPNPVVYPFTGFGGTTVDRQVSGTRTYDVNVDGVAHYGLYPDWIEDLRMLAGDEIVADLERGPEAYLQMWERTRGVPVVPCGEPRGAVTVGMTAEEVLRAAGQPEVRTGDAFTYCDLTVRFDGAGRVVAAEGGSDTGPGQLPATGWSGLTPLALLLLAGGLALRVVAR